MTSVQHPIVHVEFLSRDRVADAKFFTELFGWEIQQMPEMNYAMFDLGGGLGGGLNPVVEGFQPDNTVVYVSTDDIDAALAKVERLGGKVLRQRTEIPGFGWFGLFTDLSGNMIGLYTQNTTEVLTSFRLNLILLSLGCLLP